MKKYFKQLTAMLLAVAMLFALNGISNLASAAAKMTISKSNVTVTVGKSTTVTLKNAPKGAKVEWSSKSTKIAKVKDGKITGVKAGNTNIVCKVTYNTNKKAKTENFTVKVTVKNEVVAGVTDTNLTKAHKSANGITTKDNGIMRTNLNALEITKAMGVAYNIGNSLDAYNIEDKANKTVADHETAWGNVQSTQATIDGLKAYGFKAVRIPIAWSNMISDDGKYTINEAFMNRVEEVMNYCLNDEMYVIINIHYDRGWWGEFGSADQAWRDKAWARYESLWTQIANRYKEYSDRLIFESANEELGDRLNDKISDKGICPVGNEVGTAGVLTEEEQYATVAKINQKFVDIVRASGGNNTYRHLLIAGFNTDITKTCNDKFVMPTDIKENGKTKLMISVHYYSPSTYCIAEADQGWGYKDSWGTDADKKSMRADLENMKKFSSQGYGVIIGEFGVQSANKDGIPAYTKELLKDSLEFGFCPVFWDTSRFYNRTKGVFNYKDVGQALLDATGSKAIIPADAQVTGLSKLVTIDESKLVKKYTWEGLFTKNDGSNKYQQFKTISCSDGLTVEAENKWGYNAHIIADWASMKQPYIRFTLGTDERSLNTSLQLDYRDMVKAPGVAKDQIVLQGSENWTGKCIKLNRDDLIKYGALIISSNNGPTFVKIEIFDLAQ